ncbi:uncharacterized protein LOC144556172 isoform X2 [Carex rostrata]
MQTLTVARSRSLLLSRGLSFFVIPPPPPPPLLSSSQNCCAEGSNVSVWWDYENCSIPAGVDEDQISDRIVSALRSNGISGPVSINAFGDIGNKMPCATQEALSSTGISLVHFPPSEMYSTEMLLRTNLMSWTAHNPPPAHFFLISGNRDFAKFLHRLRMDNYNVLLSCSHIQVKASLYYAATLMWPWIPLVKGENFTPQQFNHPPVGMYGSWYGHCKPLDDPFKKDCPKMHC